MSLFPPPDGGELVCVVSEEPMGDHGNANPESFLLDRQHQHSNMPAMEIVHTGSCHLGGLLHTLIGCTEGVLMRIEFQPEYPSQGTKQRARPWSHLFELVGGIEFTVTSCECF
jgi:hypothetical protein